MLREVSTRLAALGTTAILALSEGSSSSGDSPSPDGTQPSRSSTSQPSREYATYLEEFCAAPATSPIDIYTWHPNQRVPAQTYIEANGQECRDKGIPVKIVVSDKPVSAGDMVKGNRVIRYHFS